MYIAEVADGEQGATGVVGGNASVAVGQTHAQKVQGTDRVVVSFFGNGTSSASSFHGTL
jgi:TPP-dependent pyruvate/acetoin dehydrogenase alpha subunit